MKKISDKWPTLVDEKIKELLYDSVDKNNYQLVWYQMSSGGKRIRPVLCLASCLAVGGKIKQAIYPAAGLEILHNCTLIYDDIIDNSETRRNQPTVWKKYGKAITECVGLYYAPAIFQAANRSLNPKGISEKMAIALKMVMDGQIMDILFEQSGRQDEPFVIKNRYKKVTQKDYLKMIGLKTASLLSACCEIGGLAGQGNKKQLKALADFGHNLGIVFQITDDLLDIFGEEKSLGKKIGKDIEERKLGNIVITYTLEEVKQLEKKMILTIFKKKKITNKDITTVLDIINKSTAKKRALKLAKYYTKKAEKNLEDLPSNKGKELLSNMITSMINRKY